jgi:GT2 family glycosyltransferase
VLSTSGKIETLPHAGPLGGTRAEIAVIVPVYNGRSMLSELCTRLLKSLATIADNFIVVLVDDASPDHSWPLIREISKTDARIKGVRLSRNFVPSRSGLIIAFAHLILIRPSAVRFCAAGRLRFGSQSSDVDETTDERR